MIYHFIHRFVKYTQYHHVMIKTAPVQVKTKNPTVHMAISHIFLSHGINGSAPKPYTDFT